MPITKTASISPSNACNPSSPTYTWTNGQNVNVGTSAALAVTFPGLYTASVRCASSPTLCTQQSSSYVMCYQGQQVVFSPTSILNITVISPTGTTVQLNTVSPFSFPYANTDAGAAALKAHLITWLAANNGNGAEVLSFKTASTGMVITMLSSWRILSVTTNVNTQNFATPTCEPASFSVSAAYTGPAPNPTLGIATATPTGCSSFVLYVWYNPSGVNVGEGASVSLTRNVTYTVRAFCGDGQWASATVFVPS